MSVSAHEGSAAQSGLIIPDNIPGDDLKPSELEEAAGALRTAGTSALAQATLAEDSWAGLPGVLESPQGPTIYAALGTPSETARAIERKFYKVSDALDDFAAALGPIKSTFVQIKTDAVVFRATIRPDEKVWISPTETQEYEFDGLATVSTTSYSTSYSTGSTLEDVVAYLQGRGERTMVSGGRVKILAHWTQSSDHIDKNNALMDRLADAYARLQNAEADCANAINRQRDLCVADVEYIEAWQLKQSGENTVVLPWGSRVDEERNCGEEFWWGAGNAGKHALEGVGALFGYNSLIGGWSWDKSWTTAGQAWAGMFQGLGSLLLMTFPLTPLLGQLGVPVFKEAYDTTTNMVKGLLAWDTWAEHPAEAAGTVLVNVGTFFIPGVGEVAGVIKGLATSSRIVDLASDAARLGDDVVAGVNKVDGLASQFDNLIGDAAGAASKTDDLVSAGIRMPDGDVLHVGSKTDSAPPTSMVDDGPSSPRPHTDDPVAPPPHTSGTDGPTAPHADPDGPPPPHTDTDGAHTPGADAGEGPSPGGGDHSPDGGSDPVDTPPTRAPWEDHPIFNDPNDPIVWRNDEYGTALTASQRADADAYLGTARASEPDITTAMQAIEAGTPEASLIGLEHAVKGEDSFYRKYATDIQNALARGLDVEDVLPNINDAVRYTFVADDVSYAASASRLIDDLEDSGFEFVGAKNFWENSDGYVGINSTWRDATGQTFEVQFHTPESFHVKDAVTHHMYEEQRLPGTTPARFDELEALQNLEFAKVPHPDGVGGIQFPRSP